jgi:hypothetical protein
MEISIEKSAIIANHKNQTKFKIFGKELPQPEKYTYLGIIWSPYKFNWKKKELEFTYEIQIIPWNKGEIQKMETLLRETARRLLSLPNLSNNAFYQEETFAI